MENDCIQDSGSKDEDKMLGSAEEIRTIQRIRYSPEELINLRNIISGHRPNRKKYTIQMEQPINSDVVTKINDISIMRKF